jgi:hypothetical protein
VIGNKLYNNKNNCNEMNQAIKALPNQSTLDIILTEYGSLEAGMQFAADNKIDISHTPVLGNEYKVIEVIREQTKPEEIGYLQRNGIQLGTLAIPVLEYAILLKPRMHIVPNVVGAPHTVGYYSFFFEESPGFVHLNPLAESYPASNRLQYESEERHVLGYLAQSQLPAAIVPMPDKSIPYILPWTVGLGYMLVWSDVDTSNVTALFRDIEGNTAYCAPVTVLDNSSQAVIEYFVGDIEIELVSATVNAVELRLTRSHPAIGLLNFQNYTMDWLEAAAGGVPDLADPTNPDKIILSLTAGVHTIGLRTNYVNVSGTLPHLYPSSACTMVVSVY